MNQHKVALLGCGTVGSGVYRLIRCSADELCKRTGQSFEPVAVAIKSLDERLSVEVPPNLLTTDAMAAARHPDASIVIETMGGVDFTFQVVMAAIEAGKHVVTANKALLAQKGPELFAAARRRGVCIGFEASCMGGVPIIGAIRLGLIANRIDALFGIVNGTCNYILTEMTQKKRTYQQALADAQKQGFAEADPTLDVSGLDSAHKLAILSSLAFGIRINFDQISVEGIDALKLSDIHAAAELGYVVKLLAIGQRDADGYSLRVHPAFIPKDHPLAGVTGPFNALSVYGSAVGHVFFYGRGAGQMPTGSAVVCDLVDVALGNAQRSFASLPIWPDQHPVTPLKPIDNIESRYYIRLMMYDRPGALAAVTRILGEHRISLSAVVQHEIPEESTDKTVVPVVIMTHRAAEGNMKAALTEAERTAVVKGKPVRIRVVEQYAEPKS
jgi:homoserine dehydrogenase